METQRSIVTVVLLGTLLAVVPPPSWGQVAERLGTVLTVVGTAEVRGPNAPQWQLLRVRDAISLEDTVRTAEASKVTLLLRDDSIMTLGERREMQFTAALLPPAQPQRRTSVPLLFVVLGGLLIVLILLMLVVGYRSVRFIVSRIPQSRRAQQEPVGKRWTPQVYKAMAQRILEDAWKHRKARSEE